MQIIQDEKFGELIYSDLWEEKNADRKDFTYTPKVKQQIDAMCWDERNPELCITILDNYISYE